MLQHPFIFSDEKKYRIRRHIIFWLAWWLFQAILYSFVALNNRSFYWVRLPNSMVESFVYIFPHIFLSYSVMYFVIPQFLLKGRYWLTALWMVLLFFLTGLFSAILAVTVIEKVRVAMLGEYYITARRGPIINIFLSLMAGLRGGITICGIAAAIKLMKYWYIKEQRILQLQKENVESQLQLLKAQVHPHFLFNTLNNIYANTQGSSPVAARMVMELSDILRFILYEGKEPFVPLSKELKLIRNYIDLEKMRYDDHLDVHIDVPDDTVDLQIAPLLLLPLIENCFKHGTSDMLEHPWLSLQVQLSDGNMKMKLVNGKVPGKRPGTTQGIGISNVRKRLELLYPGKHSFSITNDPDVFIVNLSIQLSGNMITGKRKSQPVTIQHE